MHRILGLVGLLALAGCTDLRDDAPEPAPNGDHVSAGDEQRFEVQADGWVTIDVDVQRVSSAPVRAAVELLDGLDVVGTEHVLLNGIDATGEVETARFTLNATGTEPVVSVHVIEGEANITIGVRSAAPGAGQDVPNTDPRWNATDGHPAVGDNHTDDTRDDPPLSQEDGPSQTGDDVNGADEPGWGDGSGRSR